MAQPIIVVAEHADGSLRKITSEVASEAVRLARTAGSEVVGIALGPGAAQAAGSLGEYGVARALAVDGNTLGEYSGEAWAAALAEAVRGQEPSMVLFGATSLARDLMPRLGAHLEVSPASDVVAIELEASTVRVQRPVYAGKALQKVTLSGVPAIASLRPNAFRAEGGQGVTTAVEEVAPAGAPEQRGTCTERVATSGGKVELSEAEVVVAGGRGLENAEKYAQLLEPLADALGAALGASRAVVDAGWRPHSEQVGQTGKVVGPKLYFACGVSGAIQHLAGMRTSKTIVAINKDPEAPIFKVADYGIVGDVTEILPVLTEQILALKKE